MFSKEGVLAFHGWTQVSYGILFRHAALLPHEAFVRSLDGFGFPTVRDQLLHIAICEDFWVTIANGREFIEWDHQSFHDAPAIFTAYQPVAARTREWISGMTTEELLQPRKVLFSEGNSALVAPAPMLHHVLTHGYHHKGQIVAMCRILGYPAPETDLDKAILT
jgi:uncharacterized damage-inducible protein DinB